MNVLWEVIHILIFKNLATACSFQVLCETCTVLWVSESGNDVRMWSNELYSVFQQSPNPAVAMMRECGAMSSAVCSNSRLTQ